MSVVVHDLSPLKDIDESDYVISDVLKAEVKPNSGFPSALQHSAFIVGMSVAPATGEDAHADDEG